jgi:DNA polymerase/3'-5' exonuclease PolX
MKFGDLKFLFMEEIEKIKKNSQPTTIYIVNAYYNVIKKINEIWDDDDIVSDIKINNINITDHMKNKLILLSKTKIPKELKNKKKKIVLKYDLKKFLGIGDKKADELIDKGLLNINQLRQKKWFNLLGKDSQLMLLYKPVRNIPYNNIKLIEKKITKYKNADVIIVGSYRRKKPYTKDIDVLINSDDPNIIDKYINHLTKKFNKIYLYSKGENKVSLLIEPFKNSQEIKYKLDIFRTYPENYYSTLLYSTGSKELNVKMRSMAKKQGKILNQNGIYLVNQNGEKIKKINTPKDDEKKLFEILGMTYIEPEYR